uniref:Uncharacterized protein n=1 Tax=Candidatus Kentrum sp. LFY TaxID=2126342 RepID=A0A450X2J8_9GAMM|nr:MAG: hypothetical protein BECKLFY1418C_GA0070996_11431 [Candidatus Kentron sp. LFY]
MELAQHGNQALFVDGLFLGSEWFALGRVNKRLWRAFTIGGGNRISTVCPLSHHSWRLSFHYWQRPSHSWRSPSGGWRSYRHLVRLPEHLVQWSGHRLPLPPGEWSWSFQGMTWALVPRTVSVRRGSSIRAQFFEDVIDPSEDQAGMLPLPALAGQASILSAKSRIRG